MRAVKLTRPMCAFERSAGEACIQRKPGGTSVSIDEETTPAMGHA